MISGSDTVHYVIGLPDETTGKRALRLSSGLFPIIQKQLIVLMGNRRGLFGYLRRRHWLGNSCGTHPLLVLLLHQFDCLRVRWHEALPVDKVVHTLSFLEAG